VPEVEILNKLEHGLDRVHIWLRNFISDETLLGIVAYLMGRGALGRGEPLFSSRFCAW